MRELKRIRGSQALDQVGARGWPSNVLQTAKIAGNAERGE